MTDTNYTASELESLEAWKAARAGEGMSVQEAASILTSIDYDHDWTFEQLLAAVPDNMLDNVMAALQISSGAHLAERAALLNYMVKRSGEHDNALSTYGELEA